MKVGLGSLSVASMLAFGLVGCSPHDPPVPPTPQRGGITESPKFLSNLEPMIVDWQPEQRGDLEIAMRDGLVIVGYDKNGFRLLKDCHVNGNYEFMGMTRRERVVRFESADDVQANLPLGGLGIAAKIGGEFEQGATLDVAMVMIGKLRTTWRNVTPKDLVGQCASASHFIRGATVGAFALDKGDRTRARAAAEIFGIGAGGGTANNSMVRIVDGQLNDCLSASPDAARAPAQCGALMRVELLPIAKSEDDAKAKALADQAAPAMSDACFKPMVMSDGKCVDPSQVAAKDVECNYGDGNGCVTACKAGNVRSCTKLAHMLAFGKGAQQSPSDAATIAARTCQAQDPQGCLLYGMLLESGSGIGRNTQQAARVYLKACEDGEAEACSRVGTMLLVGYGDVPRDPDAAAKVLARGCKGGAHGACSDLGLIFMGGQGFAKDLDMAAALFKRACDGDSWVGCENFAYMQEFGQGTAKDIASAVRYYTKACEGDNANCMWLGAMYQRGAGVQKSEQAAIKLYRAACDAGHVPSCALVKAYLIPAQTIDKDMYDAYVKLWNNTCQAGGPRDCSGLGVLMMAAGQRDRAAMYYKRGCELGDDWGCMIGSIPPR